MDFHTIRHDVNDGILNRPEHLNAFTVTMGDRSPVAVALSRQMVRRNATLTHPDQAHRIDSLAMFWTSIGDGKEGVTAFLEKRKPHFHGRASEMPDFYNDWIADQP